MSIRLDLTGDYITSPINDTTSAIVGGPVADDSRFDLGMDAMLSLAFGGKKAPEGFGHGRRGGQVRPLPEHPRG